MASVNSEKTSNSFSAQFPHLSLLHVLGFVLIKFSSLHPLMASTSKRNCKKNKNPEAQFRFQLETCSKTNDLITAISLYQSALSQNLHVTPYHYNALLHLCSTSISNPSLKSTAIPFGFSVFNDMNSCKAVINEATVTAVARLAVAKGEGEYAFSLVKNLGEMGLVPKLRSYDPALLYFCGNGEADRAYEVEEHMVSVGVRLEEQELAALLRMSVETKRGVRVYDYLHKLRREVRCVRLETAKIIEDWFHNEVEGSENLDVKRGVGAWWIQMVESVGVVD